MDHWQHYEVGFSRSQWNGLVESDFEQRIAIDDAASRAGGAVRMYRLHPEALSIDVIVEGEADLRSTGAEIAAAAGGRIEQADRHPAPMGPWETCDDHGVAWPCQFCREG